jgi:hypothetical protein
MTDHYKCKCCPGYRSMKNRDRHEKSRTHMKHLVKYQHARLWDQRNAESELLKKIINSLTELQKTHPDVIKSKHLDLAILRWQETQLISQR